MTATNATRTPDQPHPDHDEQTATSWRHIWAISWPIFLANITFPLVGAADTAMMGRLDDASFVGGVALGSMVFNFIYFGLGFLRMCTTGLVAQAHGRGDLREIEHLMVRGLLVAFILGTLFILATPLVHIVTTAMLAASAEVEVLMREYVGIRLLAVPAALANMVLLGCLFGRQQMHLAMLQLTLVNCLNLGLNMLFVLHLDMQIDGVAWASVLAQWIGFVITMGLVRWRWQDMLTGFASRTFTLRPSWFDLPAFREFFVIGGDLVIRTALLVMSEAILLNKAAMIGDLPLASVQLILVMFGLIAFGLDGFAHAAEALVGEAVGRRNQRMLDIVVRRTNIFAGLSACVLSVLIWFGGSAYLGLMTTQAELAAMTLDHWHWAALMAPAAFLAFQMDGVFVGATRSRDMRNAMLVSAGGFLLLVLLLERYGLNGLLLAFTIYLGLRGVTLHFRMDAVRAMAAPQQR